VSELTVGQSSSEPQQVKEVDRLQEKLAHSEREIQSIRADKVERAGDLYSVFSISVVGRVKQNLKAALKVF
jgi:hypothetical protein